MKYPFLAVDIGNARMKIGVFDSIAGDRSPEPLQTLSLDGDAPQFDCLTSWLSDLLEKKGTGSERSEVPVPFEKKGTGSERSEVPVPFLSWFLASVNRPGATRLIDWLREHRPDDAVTLLSAGDLPLTVRLERPDMVGIDRLVDAVAVNRLRDPARPAVIVDVGTAITVDLVSADGAFLGGSILPGLSISARALHQFTDLLPVVDISEFSNPPPALGASTESAMRSGLFWGTVGAIRQLIEQLSGVPLLRQKQCSEDQNQAARSVPLLRQKQCSEDQNQAARPQIFLTGGAGATVAELLGPDAQYTPHLTLAGIAISITG